MGEPKRTIRVSEAVYDRIEAHGLEGETIEETLERILPRPSLRELAGILSEEEAEAFREAIADSHRVHDDEIGRTF